jgi:cell division protein FtsA
MEAIQSSQQVVALDIGTSKIAVAIADVDEHGNAHVVGFSKVPAHGVQNGCIQDVALAVDSIRRALIEAQEMSQRTITSVAVALTGKSLRSQNKIGRLVMQDREIDTKSVRQARQLAMTFDSKVDAKTEDETIVCHLLQGFTLDNDSTVIQDPVGMSCHVLNAHAHLAIGSDTIIANLVKCVRRAGVDVECLVLQPWASAACCVTPTEMQLGVVVMDMGAGAIDIACYKDGKIELTAVAPIGGDFLTRDVAAILYCTLDDAEELKLTYGRIGVRPEDSLEAIRYVYEAGNEGEERELTRDQLVRILETRARELVDYIVRSFLVPGQWPQKAASGIVLTGGMSNLPGLAEMIEQKTGLPVRIGRPKEIKDAPIQLTAPEDATVMGIFREVHKRRRLNGTKASNPRAGFGILGMIKRFFIGDFSS